MTVDEAFSDRLLGLFAVELEERLEVLQRLLGSLRGGEALDDGTRQEALRAAHSLKGAARSVGQTDIELACHEIETWLLEPRPPGAPLGGEFRPVLERLMGLAARFEVDAPAVEPGASAGAEERPEAERWVRIPQKGFDRLLGETEALIGQIGAVSGASPADGAPWASALEQRASSCTTALREAQLAPVASAWRGLEHEVRELARAQGKDATLRAIGGDAEIGRSVAENLRDPLRHLASNAVVHGVEGPDERCAAGKPEQGLVTITATVHSDGLALVVTDDGRGLHSSLLAGVSEAGSVFTAGFTTAVETTTVAGRGLGLDIVSSTVLGMGGDVDITSTPGDGTTVRIEVPVTVSAVRVLVVRAGGRLYGFPASTVRRVVRHDAGGALRDDSGEAVPLVTFGEAAPAPGAPATERARFAVLMDGRRGPVGMTVDEILDVREVVVRPAPVLARISAVTGAFEFGTELAGLVGNPNRLADPTAAARPAGPEPPARRQVLLAEDSRVTRAQMTSTLRDAGYHVVAVADGESAMKMARERSFDLVVSDVSMPRMSGTDLCLAIRADPRLSSLPVVLVSSDESPEARRLAYEAGASSFVGKSTMADLVPMLEGLR